MSPSPSPQKEKDADRALKAVAESTEMMQHVLQDPVAHGPSGVRKALTSCVVIMTKYGIILTSLVIAGQYSALAYWVAASWALLTLLYKTNVFLLKMQHKISLFVVRVMFLPLIVTNWTFTHLTSAFSHAVESVSKKMYNVSPMSRNEIKHQQELLNAQRQHHGVGGGGKKDNYEDQLMNVVDMMKHAKQMARRQSLN